MQKLFVVARFVFAGLICFTLASLFHTQAVLMGLTELGIQIELATRLSTIQEDFFGLLPTYGVIILIGLAIAFVIAHMIVTKFNQRPLIMYPLAGALAMLTILMAMHPILNITLLAGAREVSGIILQCIAGAIGGVVLVITARHPQ